DDLHGATAQHVRGTHQNRVARPSRHLNRLLDAGGRAVLRLPDPQPAGDGIETPAILGHVDGVRRRTQYGHARRLELPGELERRLATKLDYHAARLLALHYLEHVLERKWLEIELVRRIEVR